MVSLSNFFEITCKINHLRLGIMQISPSAPNFEEGLLTYGNPSFFVPGSRRQGTAAHFSTHLGTLVKVLGQETIGTAPSAQTKRPAPSLLLEKLCADGPRLRKSCNALLKGCRNARNHSSQSEGPQDEAGRAQCRGRRRGREGRMEGLR